MTRFGRVGRWTAIGGAALLIIGVLAMLAGLRVNTSKSIPLGLYVTSRAPITKGAYVLVCLPPLPAVHEAFRRGYIGAGFCPGGFGYVFKTILAAKTDQVVIAPDGVRVNGALLPLSAPRDTDPSGRPMPRYPSDPVTLGPTQVLLMSDVSPTSFDARYYGPVDIVQIQTVVRPLFTW